MLFSIALVLFFGFIGGLIFNKLRLPKLVGMIIVGFLIGPSVLDLLDVKMLLISQELRQIALVIILTRAGLSLDIDSLKEIGKPAILMSFIPASLEIIGISIFAPLLLNISVFEALLLGSVLAAVSPAVIVPSMIKLQKEKYGNKKKIPELIMASASVDDIFVIVIFYSFLGLVENNAFNASFLFSIPLSIGLGIILGIVTGFSLSFVFKKVKISNTYKVLLILSLSFGKIFLEEVLKNIIPFSALISIMTLGIVLYFLNKEDAKSLKRGYGYLWGFFEIFLFVLIGAAVDFNIAFNNGINVVILIFIGLIFRSIGVVICLIKTKLNIKEKLFVILSFLPKATVQASIGGIALSYGLDSGNLILSIAVTSIIISAPLGAILIETTYKRLLKIEE